MKNRDLHFFVLIFLAIVNLFSMAQMTFSHCDLWMRLKSQRLRLDILIYKLFQRDSGWRFESRSRDLGPAPKGPNLEELQSRLKFSILTFTITHKNTASLEIFILAWNNFSRSETPWRPHLRIRVKQVRFGKLVFLQRMEHFWAQKTWFWAVSHYVFSEKFESTSVRNMVYRHVWFFEVFFAFFSTKTSVLGMSTLSTTYP